MSGAPVPVPASTLAVLPTAGIGSAATREIAVPHDPVAGAPGFDDD